MGGKLGREFAAVVIALTAVSTMAVVAQPSGASDASIYKFNFNVDATTHLQKLDQTITVHGGTFSGGIDFATTGDFAPLTGNFTLPDTTFTYQAAGILPVLTATARIAPTAPVTGTLQLSTLTVTATAKFNIKIVSAIAAGTTGPNLVGNSCRTSSPISVTMSGPASFGSASVFTGAFTIPKLIYCGVAQTTALNLVLPGPGNTFTASATPK
jgi:hypothetical protein